MKALFLLFLSMVVGLAPVCCEAEASPTIADAAQILNHRIGEQSAGRIRLLVFKSESGAKPAPWDNDGERRFLIAYEARIVFDAPCLWATQLEEQPVTFKIFNPGVFEPSRNRILNIARAGEQYLIRGQIGLKAAGTGWEATGFTWSDPPERVQASTDGGNFPSAVLENELLKVRCYLPDGQHGYYRATRFDWSGLISRVEYDGHRFFSDFRQTHDPLNHDDTCGSSEEFGINSPPGYSEAQPGGLFLKIGIGLLVKPSEENYNFARRYTIAQEAPWLITQEPGKIEFRQEFKTTNGWAYIYVKTLQLDPHAPVLTIRRMLKNTGERAIATDHYGHNFLKIDGVPAGPDYRLDFPFAPRFGQGSRPNGCLEVQARSLVWLKPVPLGKSVWVRLEGFSSTQDNKISVHNQRTGATLDITTDQPASRMAFFSQDGVLSPEPFVEVNLPPGGTKEWKTSYTFGTTHPH